MEYNLIVRAGKNGSAYHIAYEGVSGLGAKYLSTHCGSGITTWGGRDTLSLSKREFKRESITCKKCLKAYDKMVAEETKEDTNKVILEEIAQLEMKIQELKSQLK